MLRLNSKEDISRLVWAMALSILLVSLAKADHVGGRRVSCDSAHHLSVKHCILYQFAD